MKKLCLTSLYAVALFVGWEGTAFATATYVETSVVNVGIDNNGNVFIDLSDVVPETGCANAEILILSNETYKANVMSLALTAKATAARVRVKTNGCNGTVPKIASGGDMGYFLVK